MALIHRRLALIRIAIAALVIVGGAAAIVVFVLPDTGAPLRATTGTATSASTTASPTTGDQALEADGGPLEAAMQCGDTVHFQLGRRLGITGIEALRSNCLEANDLAVSRSVCVASASNESQCKNAYTDDRPWKCSFEAATGLRANDDDRQVSCVSGKGRTVSFIVHPEDLNPSGARALAGAQITTDGLGVLEIGSSIKDLSRFNGIGFSSSTIASDDCNTGSVVGEPNVGILSNGDTLARIDISGPGYSTPAGIHVGSTAQRLQEAYGGDLTTEPGYYDDTTTVATFSSGDPMEIGLIKFTVSQAGRVTWISTGREPEIDYVEGCA